MSTASIRREPARTTPPSAPWWRYPMVWMVIAGPLIVVVAGLFTAKLALQSPDPVLTEATSSARGPVPNRPESPAMAARNHAATPAAPTTDKR